MAWQEVDRKYIKCLLGRMASAAIVAATVAAVVPSEDVSSK